MTKQKGLNVCTCFILKGWDLIWEWQRREDERKEEGIRSHASVIIESSIHTTTFITDAISQHPTCTDFTVMIWSSQSNRELQMGIFGEQTRKTETESPFHNSTTKRSCCFFCCCFVFNPEYLKSTSQSQIGYELMLAILTNSFHQFAKTWFADTNKMMVKLDSIQIT